MAKKPASQSQLAFIGKLIAEKEMPAKSAEVFRETVNNGLSSAQASALIESLLSLSSKPEFLPAASQNQVAFVQKLLGEKELPLDPSPQFQEALAAFHAKEIKAAQASNLIEVLLRRPKSKNAVEVPVGIHGLGDEIFKVQKSPTTGNVYAKRLVKTRALCKGHSQNGELVYCDQGLCEFDPWDVEFFYAQGAVAKLSEETLLSLAEAKQFGLLYGTCIRCGRTLTDEGSIAEGIGPVCATKFAD